MQDQINVGGGGQSMNVSKNVVVYSHSNISKSQGSSIGSIGVKNRMEHLTSDVASELNTYRNWIPCQLLLPANIEAIDKDGKYIEGKEVDALGVKAIFNQVNAVPLYDRVRIANNMPLTDNPTEREEIRKKSDCTVRTLVRESQSAESNMGRAIYSYADFMYCKHLGRISNNYLITLRRFPYPAGDHINYTIHDEKLANQHMPDIGRMVTWLGVSGNEMGNILKYSVKMPFKEHKAELQKQQMNTDQDNGPLGNILNAADGRNQQLSRDGAYGRQTLASMNALLGSSKAGKMLNGVTAPPPYDIGSFNLDAKSNKIYGPIDVVKKVYMRDDEEGLNFQHKMTLVFEYELRSYDGINGKAAFLDLIGNILATTYTQGNFWGGGVQFFGTHQSNLFANLPIFQKGLTFNNLSDRAWQSYTAISNHYGGTNVLDTFLKMAKEVVKGFGSALLGGMLNKLGRPQRMGMNALLSGAPVGLWHVMVGNPKNPILSMGNMILENTTIEHTGPLGIDDFPTGLKVTCELTHGKGRDKSLIEQMYLMGDNRIYSPMGSKIEEMYKNAKGYKVETVKVTNQITEVTGTGANQKTSVKFEDKEVTENQGLIKFFGTENVQSIVAASKEANFGSDPGSKKTSKNGKGKK